ncbi:MAG: M42 family metallopeptidase [Acholeplasmataceae bacterium]
MIKTIYNDLFQLPGIAGHEKHVRKYMEAFMQKFPNFEIKKDHLGSIFAVKQAKDPNAPRVMIAGHMDEVGLIVTQITDLGMLKVLAIGGLNGEVFISQVLDVHTKSGVISGVIGALPPHLKTAQKTDIDDLLLDIGASSKKEAQDFGVEPGDMVTFQNPYTEAPNKKRLIAKSIDNRFGCGLALETIEHFHDIDLPFTLICGATVQEEVGLRGAQTSVTMLDPQVFIALDASPVNDMKKNDSLGALGEGFLVRMHDPRNVMLGHLLRYFVNTATAHNIKFQYFTSKGGTDAAKALDLNHGVLATTIGLPARYIHSSAAMMDINDLQSAKDMLFAVLNDLDPQKIKRLQEGLDG